MVLEFSGQDLVQERLLQRLIRDVLPLVDAGEALGFFRECIRFHLTRERSNSFNSHPPLFLSELNFRLCPESTPHLPRPESGLLSGVLRNFLGTGWGLNRFVIFPTPRWMDALNPLHFPKSPIRHYQKPSVPFANTARQSSDGNIPAVAAPSSFLGYP